MYKNPVEDNSVDSEPVTLLAPMSGSSMCSWCGLWQPLPTSSTAEIKGELGNQPAVAQADAVAAGSDPYMNIGEPGNQPTVTTSRVGVAAAKSDPNRATHAQMESRKALSVESIELIAKWKSQVPMVMHQLLRPSKGMKSIASREAKLQGLHLCRHPL